MAKSLLRKIPYQAWIAAAVLIAAWQIAGMAANMPHILPAPSDIFVRIWELRETLFRNHLPATLITILSGWALSAGIGTGLAVLMYFSRHARAMLHPVLLVTQTIPMMCISPLFVLWMGYTTGARLLAVVLSTFYSITLNTYDGLASTDSGKKELLFTYGAGRKEIFFRLEVPSAFPRFLTGVKMTAPWVVVDAAAAEWLGANRGLGYFSKRMISTMDGAAVFAPIFVLCAVALVLMGLVQLADRIWGNYRKEL